MLSIAMWLLLATLVPRAEDPFPDHIGVGFPFAMAAGAAVLAGVIYADAARARRERAIGNAGRIGFLLGAFWYLVALAFEVWFR